MFRIKKNFNQSALLYHQLINFNKNFLYKNSLFRILSSNFCSIIKKDQNDFEVTESENLNFDFSQIDVPKITEMSKLTNLYLKNKVEKIKKQGSFTTDLFLGKIDTDFLYFPKIVTNRKEFVEIRKQNAMLNQNFKNLITSSNTHNQLKELGFFDIWKNSMTEKCTIFESIGQSMSDDILINQLSLKNKKNVDKIYENDFKNLLIKIVLDNLSGTCIDISAEKNNSIKYKTLLENGAKFGYAFNETEKKLGSLPYTDWNTRASLTKDKKHWIIEGEKNKILNDNYDYYIVFAKTNDYPQDNISSFNTNYEEPYDGIVSFIISKNDVTVSEDEENNLEDSGFKYSKIKIDNIKVAREDELFEAEEYGFSSLNTRGIGILFMTSYQLGILKSINKQVYSYLIENKNEFLDNAAVQDTLLDLTEIIYSIESMIYLVAAMYDTFDVKFFPDINLETSILKTFTTEHSRLFLMKLQILLGSKLMQTSNLHNLVNLYDSMFDSSIHHKLFLASTASHFSGVFYSNDVLKYNLPLFYPSYIIYKKFQLSKNESDNPTLTHEVSGNLHPKLNIQGNNLEYCIKRLEYATFICLHRWKKDLNDKQVDLINLSEIAINIFLMTACLSRSSRSQIEGLQNADDEIKLATRIVLNKTFKIKSLVERIENALELYENAYDSKIHSTNVKFGGYFPYPPYETIFY